MKLAFIFVLVGYGPRPDWHRCTTGCPMRRARLRARSALFCRWTAFYAIMRFVSIVTPSTGEAFTGNLLIIFGLISVGIAAIFILVQNNFKRLLAYSSVEHMGIIVLGVGIGGPVAFTVHCSMC